MSISSRLMRPISSRMRAGTICCPRTAPKMYSGRLAAMPSKRFVGFWNSLSDDERRNFIDSLYASRHKGYGTSGSLVVDVLKRLLPVRGAFVG